MVSIQKAVESMLGSTAGFMATISTRNLQRQKRNTILTLIVISVSMLTFVLSVSIVTSSFMDVTEYTVTTEQFGTGLIVRDYQNFLSYSDMANLAEIQGISTVIPRIKMLGRLNINELMINGSSEVSRSISVPFATDYTLEDYFSNISSVLAGGSLPASQYDICITTDLAEEINVSIGDSLTVRTLFFSDPYTYNVSGIITMAKLQSKTDFTGNWILPEEVGSPNHDPITASKSAFMSFESLWTLLPQIREVLISDQCYNEFLIKTASTADLENIVSSILPIEVGQTREIILSIGEERRLYKIGTSTSIRGFTFMIFVLLISALIMLNTLLGAISARMKDIEVWSSVGANPSHIKYNFMFESLIFGLIGGSLGYIGAIIVAFLGNIFKFTTSITPNKLDFNWVFVTILVAIIVCLIASIYPSRKASTAVVPSLRRSWKPGLGQMLTQQYTFDEEEIPITLEPRDFLDYAEYIQTRMDIPTFFKVKRKWPVEISELHDGTKKRSFKLDVAVFSAEGTYAIIQIWSVEKTESQTMKVFAKVNPYSSFGESSGWAQNSTNFNKASFDTLDMIRQLSLKWRVEGRRYTIQRE
ncbi:MAG: ABC transporter permease [Candidatus Hodarchaeota archaeon]